MINLYHGDNLEILPTFDDQSFDLIYIDPPFNTGKTQSRQQTKMRRLAEDETGGDRTGFLGRRYETTVLSSKSYQDSFGDYEAFLIPRLEQAYRLLKPNGAFFFHIDYRESHYCKVLIDSIFGRDCFMNQIIWAYDYGARSTKKWPSKHDCIFWYAKNPKSYTFNIKECDRIPYLAPALVGPEKAAKGKLPTDVWWNTIVSPTGKEKTGYPTQKPRKILDRILTVHSNPGDQVLDFFAGSGTTGASSEALGRNATLVDQNLPAIEVMQQRFAAEFENLDFKFYPQKQS